MSAILFEVLFIQTQEEIHLFAVLGGGSVEGRQNCEPIFCELIEVCLIFVLFFSLCGLGEERRSPRQVKGGEGGGFVENEGPGGPHPRRRRRGWVAQGQGGCPRGWGNHFWWGGRGPKVRLAALPVALHIIPM